MSRVGPIISHYARMANNLERWSVTGLSQSKGSQPVTDRRSVPASGAYPS